MAIATPRKIGDCLSVTAAGNNTELLRLKSEGARPEVIWHGNKKLGFSSVFSTPFVEGGYIYGSGGDPDGELYCVKADTGERVWATLEHLGGKKARSADVFIIKNGDRF